MPFDLIILMLLIIGLFAWFLVKVVRFTKSSAEQKKTSFTQLIGCLGMFVFLAFVRLGVDYVNTSAIPWWKNKGWHTLYSNSDMEIEVKLKSINRNGNIVSFEEKTTYSQKALKERINASSDKEKWRNFKYAIINRDVDCYNSLTRWWAVVYYDDAGKVIDKTETTPIWNKEEPHGSGSIYQFVCRSPAK